MPRDESEDEVLDFLRREPIQPDALVYFKIKGESQARCVKLLSNGQSTEEENLNHLLWLYNKRVGYRWVLAEYREVEGVVPSEGVTYINLHADDGMQRITVTEDPRYHGSLVQAYKNGLEGLTPAEFCLLYTSPSPRDKRQSRMPSSA